MSDHPLAGPIFTRPKDPQTCAVCNRKEAWMRALADGRAECSHVDCPHRKTLSAQPMTPYFKEQYE